MTFSSTEKAPRRYNLTQRFVRQIVRDVNVTRSLKNNGFSFEFPQSLWKTELFVISKCNEGFDLFNILNTFNWLFQFLVEEFVSFEMYFLQVWRSLRFSASNQILGPEWLPLFFPYFQTLIILTQWYVRKRYPCLAWPVNIVFMVRCSVFAKTSW